VPSLSYTYRSLFPNLVASHNLFDLIHAGAELGSPGLTDK
jgi:hypothetical protein